MKENPQQTPLVSVNVLSYNSRKYLKDFMESLLSQTYPNLEILFIDNDSQDESIEFVRKNYPTLKIIANKENLGYAGGHNLGIKISKGEYVLCLNPDMVLEQDFVEKLVKTMQEDNRIGVAGGKILRYDFENQKKTNIIDTTGIEIFKSRRIIDRGQGEINKGQYNKKEEVFGISGVAPLFRKKALEDIKVYVRLRPTGASADAQNYNQIKDLDNFGEYFDKGFFAYKEDIDLCWRMRLYGWQCVYEPKAIAYHVRTSRRSSKKGYKAFIENEKTKPLFVKVISQRNHLLMLCKNELCLHALKNLPWIFWREFQLFIYRLFFEPRTLKAYLQFFKLLPRISKKRRVIMKNKKVGRKEIEKWFK